MPRDDHDYDPFPFKWESQRRCPHCARPSLHSVRRPDVLWCDVCGVISATGGTHWSLVPADRPEHKRSDSTYWREQYQAEANENHATRVALGVDPEDPDETLSAKAVQRELDKLGQARALLVEYMETPFGVDEPVWEDKVFCFLYPERCTEDGRRTYGPTDEGRVFVAVDDSGPTLRRGRRPRKDPPDGDAA